MVEKNFFIFNINSLPSLDIEIVNNNHNNDVIIRGNNNNNNDGNKKNLVFHLLNSLANHLKGDRQVIREYLKGNKSGYYRGKWKFTYKN
jgi:hypothetical protein